MDNKKIDKQLSKNLSIKMPIGSWILVYMSVLNQIDYLAKHGLELFSADTYYALCTKYGIIKDIFTEPGIADLKVQIDIISNIPQ